jgi:hypothetical protein
MQRIDAATRQLVEMCLCLCVRRATCLMGGPFQASELGEEAGGCILSFCLLQPTSILLAYLPSASSLRYKSVRAKHDRELSRNKHTSTAIAVTQRCDTLLL